MHIELGDPRVLFDEIRALGMRVGLSFEPQTPFAAVEPYLAEIDLLLVMSVHTGFGGQPFIPEVLDKVRAARAVIDSRGLPVEIEIDGGIKIDNAHLAVDGRRRHPRVGHRHLRRRRSRGRGPGDPRRGSVTLAAKVLTVSDGVAAGPATTQRRALVEHLTTAGYEVASIALTTARGGREALADLADGFAG